MQITDIKKKGAIPVIAVIAIVFIDQLIKFAVKTNFCLHESVEITSWMYLLFVENSGMAFGMSFIGTMFLTIVRIALVVLLTLYLRQIVVNRFPRGYIICVSMVLAGALGNIIDCLFYGLLFGPSTYTEVAQFLPEGGGYAPFFFGKVVDMFYFPIIDTTFPDWMPLIGGNPFRFFAPVFNFADSCVTCGALYLILFQWRFFARDEKKEK